MSGTSVDGIDAVALDFAHHPPKLLGSVQLDFSRECHQQIQTTISKQQHRFFDLAQLENLLAEHYARAVQQLLDQCHLNKTAIAAIGNHGQTVFHHIGSELQFSVQLGNNHLLAERTGIAVVGHFRERDIAAGGQGAPLVAGFHADFFGREAADIAVLNIGGIANISLLHGKEVCCAFDTGAGNTLLDACTQREFGCLYDAGGALSAKGKIDTQLLEILCATPYHRLPIPKSTGRELFNLAWLDEQLGQLDYPIERHNLLATLCEYTASSIAMGLAMAIQARHIDQLELIICGGGVNNTELISRLAARLCEFETVKISLNSSAAYHLDPQLVEASAFAWLAMRHINQQSNNCPPATGAHGLRILGVYYPANL